jgi:hypothetical protein
MNTPEQSGHEQAPEELIPSSAPLETVRPSLSPKRVIRRKPILGETDEVPLPRAEGASRSNITYTAGGTFQQSGPGSNQRRRQNTLKLIGVVVLANNLLIAAVVFWFVNHTMGDISTRLQGPTISHPIGEQTDKSSPSPSAALASSEASEKHAAAIEANLKDQISDLQRQLDHSKQDAEASAKQRDEMDKKVSDVTRRMAAMTTLIQDLSVPHSAASVAPVAPENTLELPPTQAEMVQLKERNRLTAFADEAIATGSRDAYEQLWKALSDPRLASLVHGARAEILRVQQCYLSGQRAKYYNLGQYQIPVGEFFPEAASLTEAQLSDDQLIHLLDDHDKVPWQARVKAAYYLGRRRTTKVGDALVKAVKEDPMLDVAAEATFSFEQITSYHAKLFEPDALEAWWKTYNSAPPPNKVSGAKPKIDDSLPLPQATLAKPPDATPEKEKSEANSGDKNDAKSEPKSEASDKDKGKGDDKKSNAKDKKKEKEKQPAIPLREPDEKP